VQASLQIAESGTGKRWGLKVDGFRRCDRDLVFGCDTRVTVAGNSTLMPSAFSTDDQFGVYHQSQDRPGARPDDPAGAARHARQRD
jgi:hypothetical protein